MGDKEDASDRSKDKEKEKIPKTKAMPHQQLDDFTAWAEKQPKPKPDDKGQNPPEPQQEQKEPREAGADKPDD